LFRKRIPIYYVLISMIVFPAATYFTMQRWLDDADKQAVSEAATTAAAEDLQCEQNVKRLTGYSKIGPLAESAKACETESLLPLKMTLTAYIADQQQSGNIISASVFLRRMADNSWININPEHVYHPASLLKVPEMITFLKKAETEPGLLEQKVLFKAPYRDLPTQYYSAKTLQPGHSYTIKELFHFMIVYSDNNANVELFARMDLAQFSSMYRAMHLTVPNMTDYSYQVGPKDYSRFLELLFNASYLSPQASEFAAELLTETTFKDGLVKRIPKNTIVAHKMGEWGDGITVELHDCGIIYLANNPYILSVMTRGTDMQHLSDVIANISQMSYEVMSSPSFNSPALATQ